jgi:hypothetical protein
MKYCKIAGKSQGHRGSRPCNRSTVDDSDKDGEQLPNEECQVKE